MVQGRKIAVAVLAALAATGAVYADMMPLPHDRPADSSSNSYDRAISEPVMAFDSPVNALPASSGWLPSTSFAELGLATEQTEPAPPTLQVLSHGPGSLNLCLYALIGLGLCQSGHWAKKSALGWVPDWYHSSAPDQIGHSHVVGPDTLRPIPLYCFIQPDDTPGDLSCPRRTDLFTSPRHPSQHTSATLPSRAPPLA